MTLKKVATISLVAVLLLAALFSLYAVPLLSAGAVRSVDSASFSENPVFMPGESFSSNPSGGGSGGG